MSPDGGTIYVFANDGMMCKINASDMSVEQTAQSEARYEPADDEQASVTPDGSHAVARIGASLLVVDTADLSSRIIRANGDYVITSQGAAITSVDHGDVSGVSGDYRNRWYLDVWNIADGGLASHIPVEGSVATLKVLCVSPDEKTLYAAVKFTDSNTVDGVPAAEVVAIDTATGAMTQMGVETEQLTPSPLSGFLHSVPIVAHLPTLALEAIPVGGQGDAAATGSATVDATSEDPEASPENSLFEPITGDVWAIDTNARTAKKVMTYDVVESNAASTSTGIAPMVISSDSSKCMVQVKDGWGIVSMSDWKTLMTIPSGDYSSWGFSHDGNLAYGFGGINVQEATSADVTDSTGKYQGTTMRVTTVDTATGETVTRDVDASAWRSRDGQYLEQQFAAYFAWARLSPDGTWCYAMYYTMTPVMNRGYTGTSALLKIPVLNGDGFQAAVQGARAPAGGGDAAVVADPRRDAVRRRGVAAGAVVAVLVAAVVAAVVVSRRRKANAMVSAGAGAGAPAAASAGPAEPTVVERPERPGADRHDSSQPGDDGDSSEGA